MTMICLLGRLTADPELRHTQSQVPVTSFTLAVDRAYQPKGQEQLNHTFPPTSVQPLHGQVQPLRILFLFQCEI